MEQAQTENSAAGGASELIDVLERTLCCPFCGFVCKSSGIGSVFCGPHKVSDEYFPVVRMHEVDCSNKVNSPAAEGATSNDVLGGGHVASTMRRPNSEKRFIVIGDGRVIDDGDFIFDARLVISGDFGDGDRLRYAQWIADALNVADATLPQSAIEQPNV